MSNIESIGASYLSDERSENSKEFSLQHDVAPEAIDRFQYFIRTNQNLDARPSSRLFAPVGSFGIHGPVVQSTMQSRVDPQDVAWLQANPLQPKVSFDGEYVDVKICKPGFRLEDYVAKTSRYEPHRILRSIELAFEGQMNGRGYYFTAARMQKMGFNIFAPTVTSFDTNIDHANRTYTMNWSLVDSSTALQFVRENMSSLESVIADVNRRRPGIENDLPPAASYAAEVANSLSYMSEVDGYKHFDESTGILHYRQRVIPRDSVHATMKANFGGPEIKRTALKVCYIELGEPELAADYAV